MDEIIDVLATIGIFGDLERDQLAQIAEHCRRDSYRRGQTIFSCGDPTHDVYFIKSGRVGITMYSQTGRETSFRQLAAGDLFGDLAAIDDRPRSTSAICISAVELVRMSDSDFRMLLHRMPDVSFRMMRRLSFLVRALTERIYEFTTYGVRNRIHAELLRLAKAQKHGASTVNIYPAPTHAEIASQVSTHREAVTREFSLLAHEGILEKRGRNLIIRDIDRLEQLVNEVNS